jgi:hypothetical protein
VLAPLLEQSLRQSMVMSPDGALIFLERPLLPPWSRRRSACCCWSSSRAEQPKPWEQHHDHHPTAAFSPTGAAMPFAGAALAQDAHPARAALNAIKPAGFPREQIEMVVVYPAGGGMDITGRVVQRFFERITGERSFVNNRTGGAGLVGHTWLATQAPADGHAIGIIANLVITDAGRSQGRWQLSDLDNIAHLNAEPLNLMVNCGGPLQDGRPARAAGRGTGTAEHHPCGERSRQLLRIPDRATGDGQWVALPQGALPGRWPRHHGAARQQC